ncbi:MAG TPA: hypothetical protein VF950_07815 [Planctomycetota bacterium]
MPLFLACLLALVARLSADDLEIRATAEAALGAVDPVHVKELRILRDRCRDIEVRARLDRIVVRLLRRESRRLYEAGRLPEALRALAEAEGPDVQARAEARLNELLRGRSMDIARTSLSPGDVEPLLPWAYPVLIRGLASGSLVLGEARSLLLQLGDRAAPALCWALRTSTPSVQSQACLLLERMGTSSPLVRDALGAAAASSDPEVRRHARRIRNGFLSTQPKR